MKKLLLVLVMSVFFVSDAHSKDSDGGNGGGSESHGGNGIACINSKDEVEKVLLEDFVEARQLFDIPERSESVSEQIKKALNKLDSFPAWDMSLAVSFAFRDRTDLKPGEHLRYLGSDHSIFAPETACPAGTVRTKDVTIANYSASGFMYLDWEYFKKMPATHQAGLLVHEGLYKLARIYNDHVNLVRVKMLVGYLFSDQADPVVIRSAVNMLLPKSERFKNVRSLDATNLLEKIDFTFMGMTLECNQKRSAHKVVLQVKRGPIGWMPLVETTSDEGVVKSTNFQSYIGNGYINLFFDYGLMNGHPFRELLTIYEDDLSALYSKEHVGDSFVSGVSFFGSMSEIDIKTAKASRGDMVCKFTSPK